MESIPPGQTLGGSVLTALDIDKINAAYFDATACLPTTTPEPTTPAGKYAPIVYSLV